VTLFLAIIFFCIYWSDAVFHDLLTPFLVVKNKALVLVYQGAAR